MTAGWRSPSRVGPWTAWCRGCCPSGPMRRRSNRRSSARRSWRGWRPLVPLSEGGSRASARLQRLLLVVPYLVTHPGAGTEELTRLFNISKKDLLSDLNLLFVSGLPPYGPGDLIEVDID